MGRELGACIGGLMKGLESVESGSLKKLSLRWLILSGDTTTPRGGLDIGKRKTGKHSGL